MNAAIGLAILALALVGLVRVALVVGRTLARAASAVAIAWRTTHPARTPVEARFHERARQLRREYGADGERYTPRPARAGGAL